LRFSELQELTDTSVTPVREALARLTAEGFTELEGHRGYRVAPVSSTDLWDIVRNRQRLESEALSLSIKHGDDHWEAQLVTAHHRNRDRFAQGSFRTNRAHGRRNPASPVVIWFGDRCDRNPFKAIDHEHHIPPRLTLAMIQREYSDETSSVGSDRPLCVGDLS